MLLKRVVETSQRIAETARRLEKISLLSALLRELAGDEIEIVTAMLSGRIRQGRIGLGYQSIRNAAAAPASEATITLLELDRTFDVIARAEGIGSERRRRELLQELVGRATASEQQFIKEVSLGELRQGALEGIMLEGLAKAGGVNVDRVRQAAMIAGDTTKIARALLERGEAGIDEFAIRLFQPVQPMLAQTAEDVVEALDELGAASLEYKLDGARIQVHKAGDEVRVFSRALNDVTIAVPEVVEAALALPAKSLILDGEALSLRPDGRPQPFQVTMRRFGRKFDVEKMRAELPIAPFWFDVLYLDGGDLLRENQRRRFEVLRELARSSVVPHLSTAEASDGHRFLEEALERGHEGIMAKSPDSQYVIGARGGAWLKIKHVKTLDLVILAAEWGSGRRKGWLSNLHLGARDVEKGGFAMLGKTFKGLTDEMLAWQTSELQKIEIGKDSYTVYVEPKIVVEIAFNDLQVSPRYASGLALRFARVKRYRPDKTVDQSDTFQTVKRIAETG
jgi:DNA ligase 1